MFLVISTCASTIYVFLSNERQIQNYGAALPPFVFRGGGRGRGLLLRWAPIFRAAVVTLDSSMPTIVKTPPKIAMSDVK